ncbi:MAG: acetyl-CoA carboxylase carboxyl transferase subunit beta [Candidatus Saganbacteria bacterium]|uniref:Acetyl-coenzyme A carboxylase carboxyl transferase subunit beta n=1 Tax=Candidatus Saganbacteria bacterium TaxID=2575572 RepID=A0A833L019_UNCSA|nr:MAG: acetyl-CoA carboxylase carboxyl transferase subunit beta [Candidatus Saganbacteria bacterium]
MAKISIQEWFSLNKKRDKEKEPQRLNIPENLWVKCHSCKTTIYNKDLEANLKVCPKCGYHYRLSSRERMKITIDEGTFKEFDANLKSCDFLAFSDTVPYQKRIEDAILKSSLNDAIVTGAGKIGGISTSLGIMDFAFMGGSMGSVVGEKFTRQVEYAIEHKLPVLVFTASGGARMQEGIMSLMQMAKTSAALERLREFCLPFIVVLTDPTTGGTTASFAMLGDIHIAEPNALIGFAGPRVIEQTLRQKLPPGFQRSEFLLKHGMIDAVCERKNMKEVLTKILTFFAEQ